MTTISPNRRRNNFSISFVLSLIAVVVLLLVVLLWRAQVGNLFWRILSPVVALRDSLDATQNAQLRAELASSTLALADRNQLYQENLLLKKQFGRDASAHLLLSAILMRPPGVPYDTFIIDVGANEGVRKGALVSSGGSTYIGTVSEVYDTTSRVTLFSSPSAVYSALVISGQSGRSVPISLEGQGAGSMSAQVPSATPLSVGDNVIVPGIRASFAGTISRIEKPEGESFEQVYVQLPANLFTLQFVGVAL